MSEHVGYDHSFGPGVGRLGDKRFQATHAASHNGETSPMMQSSVEGAARPFGFTAEEAAAPVHDAGLQLTARIVSSADEARATREPFTTPVAQGTEHAPAADLNTEPVEEAAPAGPLPETVPVESNAKPAQPASAGHALPPSPPFSEFSKEYVGYIGRGLNAMYKTLPAQPLEAGELFKPKTAPASGSGTLSGVARARAKLAADAEVARQAKEAEARTAAAKAVEDAELAAVEPPKETADLVVREPSKELVWERHGENGESIADKTANHTRFVLPNRQQLRDSKDLQAVRAELRPSDTIDPAFREALDRPVAVVDFEPAATPAEQTEAEADKEVAAAGVAEVAETVTEDTSEGAEVVEAAQAAEAPTAAPAEQATEEPKEQIQVDMTRGTGRRRRPYDPALDGEISSAAVTEQQTEQVTPAEQTEAEADKEVAAAGVAEVAETVTEDTSEVVETEAATAVESSPLIVSAEVETAQNDGDGESLGVIGTVPLVARQPIALGMATTAETATVEQEPEDKRVYTGTIQDDSTGIDMNGLTLTAAHDTAPKARGGKEWDDKVLAAAAGANQNQDGQGEIGLARVYELHTRGERVAITTGNLALAAGNKDSLGGESTSYPRLDTPEQDAASNATEDAGGDTADRRDTDRTATTNNSAETSTEPSAAELGRIIATGVRKSLGRLAFKFGEWASGDESNTDR